MKITSFKDIYLSIQSYFCDYYINMPTNQNHINKDMWIYSNINSWMQKLSETNIITCVSTSLVHNAFVDLFRDNIIFYKHDEKNIVNTFISSRVIYNIIKIWNNTSLLTPIKE